MSIRSVSLCALALAMAFAGVGQAQVPYLICDESISLPGYLNQGSPTYNRVESGSTEASCTVSDYATDVYYSAFVIDAQTAGHLVASFCEDIYNFDTFLSVYQDPAGGAGAFDPLDPCTNLLGANDDACGLLSRVGANLASEGEVTVVVSSFANGQMGNFTLDLTLLCPAPMIPTLGSLGFAAFGLLLLGAGWLVLRRRSAA